MIHLKLMMVLFLFLLRCSAIATESIELNELSSLTQSVISQTAYVESLPEEIFWFMIFDNKETLTEEDIYSLCCASKTLHLFLKNLVPNVILSRFPSVRQVLTALQAFERSEQKYAALFVKLPDRVQYFVRYQHEVQRLVNAEPYMKFSPLFWWCNGSNRIQALSLLHNLKDEATNLDWIDRARCHISALVRDPIICGCVSVSFIVYYTILGLKVHEENKIYQEAYDKNLNYTTTEAFVKSQVDWGNNNRINFPNIHPQSCFDDLYNPYQKLWTCWNVSKLCHNNNPLLKTVNETLHDYIEKMWSTLKNSPSNCFIKSTDITTNDILLSALEQFKQICQHADGWKDMYMQRIGQYPLLLNSWITTWSQVHNCGGDNNSWDNVEVGYFNPIVHCYNPQCVADSLTPQGAIDIWITTGFFAPFCFLVFIIIGWTITF